jgi:3'-5' exoribonuclease 1
MNYIVFDLESTCWQTNMPVLVQETIEIGAVLLNPFGEVEGKFARFIRPTVNPILSHFCRELTNITQEQVNRARPFAEVIDDFMVWADMYDDEDYCLCSWGGFDRRQLAADCALHRLNADWTRKHANLKDQYQRLKRLRQPRGLVNALDAEGFDFDGQPHRALPDAENLVKIFNKYIDSWDLNG